MSAGSKSFTKEILCQKYLDDVRKTTSELGISKIRSFSKFQIIDIILDKQAQSHPQGLQAQTPPKLNEP